MIFFTKRADKYTAGEPLRIQQPEQKTEQAIKLLSQEEIQKIDEGILENWTELDQYAFEINNPIYSLFERVSEYRGSAYSEELLLKIFGKAEKFVKNDQNIHVLRALFTKHLLDVVWNTKILNSIVNINLIKIVEFQIEKKVPITGRDLYFRLWQKVCDPDTANKVFDCLQKIQESGLLAEDDETKNAFEKALQNTRKLPEDAFGENSKNAIDKLLEYKIIDKITHQELESLVDSGTLSEIQSEKIAFKLFKEYLKMNGYNELHGMKELTKNNKIIDELIPSLEELFKIFSSDSSVEKYYIDGLSAASDHFDRERILKLAFSYFPRENQYEDIFRYLDTLDENNEVKEIIKKLRSLIIEKRKLQSEMLENVDDLFAEYSNDIIFEKIRTAFLSVDELKLFSDIRDAIQPKKVEHDKVVQLIEQQR